MTEKDFDVYTPAPEDSADTTAVSVDDLEIVPAPAQ